MSRLELKDFRRLGYAFGLRQAGVLVTVTCPGDAAPLPDDQALALRERVRACLEHASSGAGSADGDPLSPFELAGWALALQRRARIPVFEQPYTLARKPRDGGQADTILLLPYVGLDAARYAMGWAVDLRNDYAEALARGEADQLLDAVAARVEEAVGKLGAWAPAGVNCYRICEAAYQERMPFGLFFRDVILLGEGVKLKRMLSTITDNVSAIGVSIARNKMQTAMALRQAGFPTVRHAAATSADHAAQLAEKSGFPTVVKPFDADGGAGVAAGLMTKKAVREAYKEAAKVSKNIIVENFVHGNNYRVHVCNGRIIKTTLRRPGGVDGDGVTSIRDLVARHKDDPQVQRRRLERGKYLLELDDEARQLLGEMDMTEDTVPAVGEFVPLRRRSNVSTGGTTTDVRGTLHPDNEAMFMRAAELLGLDFAGIDYISPDISKSWLEVPSAICEINAQPQLGNDLNPKLYNELLREYMGGPGRIPWTMVLGGTGNRADTTALCERVRAVMDKRLSPAVVAAANGVWIGSTRIAGDQGSLAGAAEHVALGRFAAAAVVAADPSQMMSSGLATADLDFLVVTNDPRPSAEQFDAAVRMLVPHIRKLLVLEQGDPALPLFRSLLPATKLLLVSTGPADDALNAHLADGGRAVWLESAAGAEEVVVALGAGPKRLRLGTLKGAGGDLRRIRDVMIARLIEVQLPLAGKPGDGDKEKVT